LIYRRLAGGRWELLRYIAIAKALTLPGVFLHDIEAHAADWLRRTQGVRTIEAAIPARKVSHLRLVVDNTRELR
jgi:hypothetical protein